ncbi:MAG TPA: hypothetical protein VN253_22690 [Kofleriaceae bacterium]|nr:hypothetical protein [Kofleriaceae bacterium]
MSVRLRVPAVDDPDFLAEVSYADGAELRLVGSATAGATESLAALLKALDAELRERATRSVVVDLKAMELMAAPCFNELVAWIARLSDLAPEERYQILVRSNPQILWQQHSLGALACFDTRIVRIES